MSLFGARTTWPAAQLYPHGFCPVATKAPAKQPSRFPGSLSKVSLHSYFIWYILRIIVLDISFLRGHRYIIGCSTYTLVPALTDTDTCVQRGIYLSIFFLRGILWAFFSNDIFTHIFVTDNITLYRITGFICTCVSHSAALCPLILKTTHIYAILCPTVCRHEIDNSTFRELWTPPFFVVCRHWVIYSSRLTAGTGVKQIKLSGKHRLHAAQYVHVFVFHGFTLQWRHNGHDGVPNQRRLDCLLKRLFRRRSINTSKLRVTGLYEGNSPVTGEFPAQMACNAENVSIWWRHHEHHQPLSCYHHIGENKYIHCFMPTYMCIMQDPPQSRDASIEVMRCFQTRVRNLFKRRLCIHYRLNGRCK